MLEAVRNNDIALFREAEQQDGPQKVYDNAFYNCMRDTSIASEIDDRGRHVPVVAMMADGKLLFKYPGGLDYKPMEEHPGDRKEQCGNAAAATQSAVERFAKVQDGKTPALRRRDQDSAPAAER